LYNQPHYKFKIASNAMATCATASAILSEGKIRRPKLSGATVCGTRISGAGILSLVGAPGRLAGPLIVILTAISSSFCGVAKSQSIDRPGSNYQATGDAAIPIAFPGAEGFGRYTTGGRGGKTVIVSNLNDDGPGSLRAAVENHKPKIVVFAVSGTIHLESRLSIKSNTTIAGQSAPGGGICIADQSVSLAGDNIIVRYIRIRMGDKFQKGGMLDGNGSDDAFGGVRRKHIIVDHCSISWSTDEVCSVYLGDSTTLQWNLISEPLNYSYHFEKGDKDYEHHGFGGIWGGKHLSGHHNLFAHCASRTPRFDGNRNAPDEFVDFRNNVIYNWSHNNVYAGEGGTYNLVNNYYKYGPDTKDNVKYRVVNPFKNDKLPYGKFFISGNYVDGSATVTMNNWSGVTMDKGEAADTIVAKANQPKPYDQVTTQSAREAYISVLKDAGAVLPVRDTLDERVIKNVEQRSGRLIDVQGALPHGTPYDQTTKAWPNLKSAAAEPDGDHDGMPDDWEKAHGLDNKIADGAGNKLDKYYTNIEVYLNGLVK
jgi:pectate lyase